jgi:RNA polymerase sigma-70 factor, ECF subfamily
VVESIESHCNDTFGEFYIFDWLRPRIFLAASQEIHGMLPASACSVLPSFRSQQNKITSTPTHNDDQAVIELVRATAQKDQIAFTKLYHQTNHLVFGLTLYLVKDRCVAEEVMLDVYLQAWHKAQQFDTGRGSPITWLMMMARSRALDHLRKTARNNYTLEPLDEIKQVATGADDPEKHSELGQRQRLIRAALARLRPEEQELIEAAYYDGLTHVELAAHFQLPLGTVKTRIRAALTRMREALRDLE